MSLTVDLQPGPAPDPAEPRRASDRRARRTEELVRQLREGEEGSDRERVYDELVCLNMPVAQSIASRYRARGIASDDLEQVAYLALTKAVRRFDPHAGYAFLSFTVPTIRGEVRRYFRDQGWMVRPPRRLQELQTNVLRAQADLTVDRGRPPTEGELAQHLGEDVGDIREALDGRGCFSPTSLDRPVGEAGEATLGDLISDTIDSSTAAVEARVALGPVVRQLSLRDRRILEMRFVDDLTQREIAENIGVTQMQVSRLLSRIFRDLREGLGPLDGGLASPSAGAPAPVS